MADEQTQKPKNSKLKYLLYLGILLLATGLSLVFSLWGNFDQVVQVFAEADVIWLLVMMGIVFASYLVDALIIKIFCRLYTKKYTLGQGLATSLIGQFYSDITPGASGGQVMEAYTLKSQGIKVSNAASIFVMWFILYQAALILTDVIALIVKWDLIFSLNGIQIGNVTIPMTPLVIFGFAINLTVILVLYLMSFSHKFHNFILHYVIGFLGKLKILKNPDKTRETLRVQVENFKIELRRLQANIPVTILIVLLFMLLLFLRNCVPYFSGFALHAFMNEEGIQVFDFGQMFDASCLLAFHQMVTGLIPIPGAAGVSEYFFQVLFTGFYPATKTVTGVRLSPSQVAAAAQILWRTASFHIMLIISGIFAATYRSKPQEDIDYANRNTFVNLQLETYAERKASSDTMYETSQISRREIQRRLQANNIDRKEKAALMKEEAAKRKAEMLAKRAAKKAERTATPKKKNDNGLGDEWDSVDIKI